MRSLFIAFQIHHSLLAIFPSAIILAIHVLHLVLLLKPLVLYRPPRQCLSEKTATSFQLVTSVIRRVYSNQLVHCFIDNLFTPPPFYQL